MTVTYIVIASMCAVCLICGWIASPCQGAERSEVIFNRLLMAGIFFVLISVLVTDLLVVGNA